MWELRTVVLAENACKASGDELETSRGLPNAALGSHAESCIVHVPCRKVYPRQTAGFVTSFGARPELCNLVRWAD